MKPYLRNERSRMFESDFFEFFSKVHPATPFVLYIPFGLALLGWGLNSGTTNVMWTAIMLPLGWVTWQFMEYFIHKKFFHWEGNTPFTRRLHDITHGYHHKYPDDDSRLVMPISVSLGLSIVVGGLLYLLNAPMQTLPYFCGLLFSYLWYDFIHWSTHNRKPLTAWGREQRAHHMAHHFACPDKNFGISHRYIDRLLKTLRVREKTDVES
jgi:dihydroceramide fatty acyl 2-hydroxylase